MCKPRHVRSCARQLPTCGQVFIIMTTAATAPSFTWHYCLPKFYIIRLVRESPSILSQNSHFSLYESVPVTLSPLSHYCLHFRQQIDSSHPCSPSATLSRGSPSSAARTNLNLQNSSSNNSATAAHSTCLASSLPGLSPEWAVASRPGKNQSCDAQRLAENQRPHP
ncbi:hypothetical protein DFJ77DRAFT_447335 [Powellomyces hirtus]|nr:hypothetical protein DFJ77DRAFT_447335 [Powellomyces hirtus]